jgi:hypothetical protein
VFVCLFGWVFCEEFVECPEWESHIHTSSLSAKPRGCQWSRDATVRHRVKLLVLSLHLFGEGRERNFFSFLLSLFFFIFPSFQIPFMRSEKRKKEKILC